MLLMFIYFNFNAALMPVHATAEETISVCKNAEKYAILTLTFEKFSGDSPQTRIVGRVDYGAAPHTPL